MRFIISEHKEINPHVRAALSRQGIINETDLANINQYIHGVSTVGWRTIAIALAKELAEPEKELQR